MLRVSATTHTKNNTSSAPVFRLWVGRASLLALMLPLAGSCAVDVSGLPSDDEDGGGPTVDMAMVDMDDDRPDRVMVTDGCAMSPESCNGLDDDCDTRVDEDIVTGVPCDGDADGCEEGVRACIGGELSCDGDPPERAGDACDGVEDADTVAEGALECDSSALICTGDCTAASETCDASDEDCDGAVDEGGVCDVGGSECFTRLFGAHVYLFCQGDAVTADLAASGCTDRGYVLLEVDSEPEHGFLKGVLDDDSWWTGAQSDATSPGGQMDKSSWTWMTSESAVANDRWADDQPNGTGQCAELVDSRDHDLNDQDCAEERYYICETPIAP